MILRCFNNLTFTYFCSVSVLLGLLLTDLTHHRAVVSPGSFFGRCRAGLLLAGLVRDKQAQGTPSKPLEQQINTFQLADLRFLMPVMYLTQVCPNLERQDWDFWKKTNKQPITIPCFCFLYSSLFQTSSLQLQVHQISSQWALTG